ncbi:hypothetical protein AVEN_221306-1 [Araneus ventricosus]|uniref:Uncharacterized protein n=1 Tax=Araneus ventricosus TaxID=182803 RepID=A0A4Y2AZ45_ARAVE|nr:hypothetical protein AVEN_221306-1 [Araneus ventricosus]
MEFLDRQSVENPSRPKQLNLNLFYHVTYYSSLITHTSYMLNFTCCSRLISNDKVILDFITFPVCLASLDMEIFNCSSRGFGHSSRSRSSSDKGSKRWLVAIGPKNWMRRPVSILLRFASS